MLLLAGRANRPTARRWEARVVGWASALALAAILTGLGTLLHQVTLFEGRMEAAFEGPAILRVLFETQAGLVWLARHSLLALLACFLLLRPSLDAPVDWIAARGEALLLAALAVGLISGASHAAAVTPGTAAAVAADVTHLVAAGLWMGGLLPLAVLLGTASGEAGEDARPYAVLAARRFSRVALGAMVLLVGSGVVSALTEIGSVAGLVGTAHGRLLLAKVAALAPILVLGAVNRTRLLPALSGPGATVGRPAMRRLASFVVVETVLALVILALASAMTVTPPARHQQPAWPFPYRLSLDVLATAPALRTRVFVASQLAVLGGVALLAAFLVTRRRAAVLAAGAVLIAAGVTLGVPPLAVDAYPTTYRRPAAPYHAASIASGIAIYREHCAECHGPAGAGDGPGARGLPRPPANLRSPHTGQHTAGDLFWWITRGFPASGMPGFGGRLADEQRWDVINFVRALGAASTAQALGPAVEPERPRLVAPDFAFAVGPAAPRALRDYRGQRIVLLVLYTLPDSRARLGQLAQGAGLLGLLGVEVILAPRSASPDAIRELGAEPRILFPVVTEGADEIVQVYGLFARTPHAEFLIDRQGYLRAIATAVPRDVNPLLAEIQQLNEEKTIVAVPSDHVH